jgi:GTPase
MPYIYFSESIMEPAYRETSTGICVAGSADAGKSSFIGVIISGKLDDGNGSSRLLVAKHQHEIKSGKTSDISTKILDIPEKNQALTIIDLCGQFTYFGSTVFGLSGYFPDYAFLIVSANNGVTPMTKQHMRILVSLSIPILVVVTRYDITPQNVYRQTIEQIKAMITSACGTKVKGEEMNNPYETKTEDEMILLEKKVKDEITEKMMVDPNIVPRTIPILSISNKTGYFIEVAKNIMKDLPVRDLWLSEDEKKVKNNKIIEYFRQRILYGLSENFIKKCMLTQLELFELQDVIKTVSFNLISKSKNHHTDPTQEKSFMSKVVSSLIPQWLTGKMSEEQFIQQLISDYCIKNECSFTDVQKGIIEKNVKAISSKLNGLDNINFEEMIINETKNQLILSVIEKYWEIEKEPNLMTLSNQFILNKFKEKEQLIHFIENLYLLANNKSLSENIRKIEISQISQRDEIKQILSKTDFENLIRGNDFDDIIFQKHQKIDGNVFYIDSCYNPPGIGLVITGLNRGEDVNVGDKMYLCPVGTKDFSEFKVKSMHNNNREIIDKLKNHGRGTIAMAIAKKGDIRRNQIRKGMIAISNLSMTKYICFRFKAAIKIFAKSVTIRQNYSAMIHLGTIKQQARVILNADENGGSDTIGFDTMSKNIAIVTFKFQCHPEFVRPYSVFLFRSGDIHGIGVVLSTLSVNDDDKAQPDHFKVKNNVKKNIK